MYFYTWLFATSLLLVSIFLKKMLIYIAMIPAWLGVIYLSGSAGVESAQYIQASAGIVMVYAIVQMWRIRKGEQI